MAEHPLGKVLQHVRNVVAAPMTGVQSDGALLRAFSLRNDHTAFAAVVKRHGPLVLAVCRRILHHEQDAEDAFQATFLVLARSTGSILQKDSLAGWLHGVASRVARKARRAATRRHRHESEARVMEPKSPALEAAWREIQALLDQEIERLPEKYREPFVLCCLENQSCAAVARQLGLKEGTIWSRLAEARKRLALRLRKQGVAAPALLSVVGLLTEPAASRVPAATIAATVAAAINGSKAATIGVVSERVAMLATTVLSGARLTRTALGVALMLGLAMIGSGALGLTRQGLAVYEPPLKPVSQPPLVVSVPKEAVKQPPRTDRYGDRLPDHAIQRLGTVRLRSAAQLLAFLPGDKRLLSVNGERDSSAIVWDVETGKIVRHLRIPTDYLVGQALAPDRKTLALSFVDTPLIVFNIESGAEIRRYEGLYKRFAGALTFSPDGKFLAGWCDDQKTRLWDLATGRTVRTMEPVQAGVLKLAFAPDGKTLASSGWDRTVRLWDVETGRQKFKLDGHRKQVWSLAFSPDGKTLASTAQDDGSIFLWNLQKGTLRDKLRGHGSPVHHVAFSPDGKLLVSGCGFEGDNSIRLWDPGNGHELRQINANYWSSGPFAFSADGRTLAAGGGDHTIRLWDTTTGKELHARGDHQSWVMALAYSPDGRSLATGCKDETVRLWDGASGTVTRKLRGHEGGVSKLAYSSDGKLLLSSGGDNIVRLRSMSDGKVLFQFGAEEGSSKHGALPVSCVTISADGSTLATSGADRVVRLWDARAGKPLRSVNNEFDVFSLAFSPDGKLVVAAGGHFSGTNGAVRVWDVATGKELRKWSPGLPWLTAAIFSVDGKKMIAAGPSSKVYLWDVATGKEESALELPEKTRIGSIKLSPDGRTLACATDRGTVRLFELATAKERTRFDGHEAIVRCLDFHPDGRKLASGSDDTTVLVWDLTGRNGADRGSSTPQLDEYWNELAGRDANVAYRAIWSLTMAPRESLRFLRNRLKPSSAPKPSDVASLIADLDRDKFAVRENAAAALEALGDLVEPDLKAALTRKPSPELERQLTALLHKAQRWSTPNLQAWRALEVLEQIGTPEAKAFLNALATGAPAARFTQEAKASLARLASRLKLSGSLPTASPP